MYVCTYFIIKRSHGDYIVSWPHFFSCAQTLRKSIRLIFPCHQYHRCSNDNRSTYNARSQNNLEYASCFALFLDSFLHQQSELDI